MQLNRLTRPFQLAVQWLGSANRVVVFRGAGVSAESGIPTFRDRLNGLWAKVDPAQLAAPDAFRNDPGLVWGWYEWCRALAAAVKPNPAHIAISALARYVPELGVVIQNVDDLRACGQRARYSSAWQPSGSTLFCLRTGL